MCFCLMYSHRGKLNLACLTYMDMQSGSKLAIITGATGGLGKAYARQLAAMGYNLLLSGRQESRLNELANELTIKYRVEVNYIAADLAKSEGICKLTANIAMLQRVDMLVSNAGYGERSMFEDELIDDVLNMISVHIHATVQLVHAVLPFMKRQHYGDIIAVSSLSAFVPAPGSSIYASTKNFLNTFMESLQMEVRKYGIRTQSLCPGLTHTHFHAGSAEGSNMQLPVLDLWMDADDVVRKSLYHLGDGDVVYVPGLKNRFIKWFISKLPRASYFALAERMTKKARRQEVYPRLA